MRQKRTMKAFWWALIAVSSTVILSMLMKQMLAH